MKKVVAILLIMIVALPVFCVPVLADLPHVPHEDPSDAESSFSAESLLLHYGDVFRAVSLREYALADGLIQRLVYANILEDYRDYVDRYGVVASDLLMALDDLDVALDEASALLEEYRLDEAAIRLGEAGVFLERAQVLIRDIEEEATEDLGTILGVFQTPAGSPEREAYGGLHVVIDVVRELVGEYRSLLEKLSGESADIQEKIEEKELVPTSMTLELSRAAAFVGESVTARGYLSSRAESLSDRTVTVHLDGEPVATATTGFRGSFRAKVPIPYRYVHTMTVEARYVPEGDDRDRYLPSVSPSREIEVMFYPTEIEIEAPDEAYPALTAVISGQLSWDGDESAVERDVKMFLDGGLQATLRVGKGSFEAEVTPEPGISVGEHTLTVAVEPSGRYAGVSRDTTLSIVRISPEVDVDAPSFTVIPRKVYVSGTVRSRFDLEGAMVSVKLRGASAEVETSEGGEFSASLSMGLNLVFVGVEDLVVRVEPAEPWHSPVEVKVRVFVLNLTNVGLTFAAAVGMGVLLVVKRRGRPGPEEWPSPETLLVAESPAKETAAARPGERYEGVKGTLLEAYVRAAAVVEEATGVRMEPHVTLREFLREATLGMHGAVEAFARLTALAERALYSSHAPEAELAAEAEKLAVEVEEVLKGGLA